MYGFLTIVLRSPTDPAPAALPIWLYEKIALLRHRSKFAPISLVRERVFAAYFIMIATTLNDQASLHHLLDPIVATVADLIARMTNVANVERPFPMGASQPLKILHHSLVQCAPPITENWPQPLGDGMGPKPPAPQDRLQKFRLNSAAKAAGFRRSLV
jgi:hypothetical protein